MTINIRKATIADIPNIQKISAITWPPTYSHIISKEQIDFMLHLMYSNESLLHQFNTAHQFFIAESQQEPIGFASVSLQERTIFKLNKLYVLPTTQKTGAGKLLLQKVVEFAKTNGGTKLQLQVNRANNAKDFYLKKGFSILYEKDFEIGNGFFMNDYVMELDLIKLN